MFKVVIVVGGGATGLGIAWDLVLRGLSVTVVEQEDIGHGTSSRFHGLLHSGGRYVVRDPVAAMDCIHENRVIKRIAPEAVEDTGGCFVQVDDEEEDYRLAWEKGMTQAGIDYHPVSASDLRHLTGVKIRAAHAFWVPDAVLEGFLLLQMLRENIQAYGGVILTHTRLRAVKTDGSGKIVGAMIQGADGEKQLSCDAVINAAGPWAQEVSQLFGDPITMHLSYGLMLIFAHRKFDVVINRLRPPGDGDIFVPHGRVTILGTTDIPVDSPNAPTPEISETLRMWQRGHEMIPEIENWRAMRAFTGVRPLYAKEATGSVLSRQVSRDFTIIDHGAGQGPGGAFSVVGGKWTTFRLMAERCVDAVLRYLAVDQACLTDRIALAPAAQNVDGSDNDTIYCECEGVRENQLRQVRGSVTEWRTRTWFSMGPCQGTFCGHRVMALRQQQYPAEDFDVNVQQFRQEREKGMQAAAFGDNARQWALQRAIRFQSLNESP